MARGGPTGRTASSQGIKQNPKGIYDRNVKDPLECQLKQKSTNFGANSSRFIYERLSFDQLLWSVLGFIIHQRFNLAWGAPGMTSHDHDDDGKEEKQSIAAASLNGDRRVCRSIIHCRLGFLFCGKTIALSSRNQRTSPSRTNEPFARLIVELGRSPRSALGWGSASLARIVFATQTRFLSSARRPPPVATLLFSVENV